MEGKIFQLNIARTGGVPKTPVAEASLTIDGFIGDTQAHPKIHGGSERAVCLYARERILELQREGHPIFPGSAGENITTEGIDWSQIKPGVRLLLGDEIIIEVNKYTVPCRTIRGSFNGGKFKRISQEFHPGDARVYARVLRGGHVHVGQRVRVIEQIELA